MNKTNPKTETGEGNAPESQIQRETVELLWNYLKHDQEHKDRRLTGWGTKTKEGLVACIARIASGE